ncbi:MAG: PAS domain-containing protein [Parvibaculum sp.]
MNSRVLTDSGRKLEQYWKSIRKADEVPLRGTFKLTAEIAPLMPHLVIAELADGDIVFRFAGTGLTERQGLNITGKRYGDFAEPLQVARAVARIKAFHATPCGFVSVHREEYERGFAVDVEVTGFPLRSDDGEGRLMVMNVTPLGTAPYTETGGRPIFMAPASHFEFIDVGQGVPDDDAIVQWAEGTAMNEGRPAEQ